SPRTPARRPPRQGGLHHGSPLLLERVLEALTRGRAGQSLHGQRLWRWRSPSPPTPCPLSPPHPLLLTVDGDVHPAWQRAVEAGEERSEFALHPERRAPL